MNLRPKTKKRLLVLLTAGVLITGTASAGIVIQLHRYEQRREGYRTAGMDAYQHADYETAVRKLTKYVGNDRMDADAIYALAVSRTKLPRPDMGHLIDAKGLFNRYLELNPTDVNAQHQLLDIYRKLGYRAETATLANNLLGANPDDVPALSAKVQQMIREGNTGAALPLSMRLNDLAPLDVRAQETTLELMNQLHRDPAELTQRADQMLTGHPADPHFELLRAIAAYCTNDVPGTDSWLRTAANHDTLDPDLTLLLVGAFNRQGLWNDSLALLEKTGSNPAAAASLRAALVQRLWELNQYDAALKIVADVHPSDPSVDSNLLGLKSLVLDSQIRESNNVATTRSAEFVDACNALQNRRYDLVAAGWSALLTATAPTTRGDPLQRVQLCELAERTDPDNPDALFVLGEQYLQLGETELARQQLQRVSQLQPEWPAPYAITAQILLDRGEAANAVVAAQDACDRDPQSNTDRIILAMARYGQLPANAAPAQIQPILDMVSQLRIRNPDHSQLLAANIDLLTKLNRKQEAIDLATSSLASTTPPSPTTLLCIATVNRTDSLGITKLLTDRAGQCQPATPEQALSLVQAYCAINNIPAAKSLLPSFKSHDTVEWKLALLQAREMVGEINTLSDWESLGALFPHDLQVQQAIMRSPVTGTNRALIDNTITRLKTLTGDDGVEWKLARARWQLDAPDDQKNNANAAAVSMAEVVRVLPQYARPQVLWADALFRLGDNAGAFAHLRIAQSLDPNNAEISAKVTQSTTQPH